MFVWYALFLKHCQPVLPVLQKFLLNPPYRCSFLSDQKSRNQAPRRNYWVLFFYAEFNSEFLFQECLLVYFVSYSLNHAYSSEKATIDRILGGWEREREHCVASKALPILELGQLFESLIHCKILTSLGKAVTDGLVNTSGTIAYLCSKGKTRRALTLSF